jgi:hypothetical protein
MSGDFRIWHLADIANLPNVRFAAQDRTFRGSQFLTHLRHVANLTVCCHPRRSGVVLGLKST